MALVWGSASLIVFFRLASLQPYAPCSQAGDERLEAF